MKRIASIALFALAACGSPSEDAKPDAAAAPARPPNEYFVWDDPSAAGGNFDADYGDCKSQIEKDPALGSSVPGLVVVNAYIKCMTPKGWKFVQPDAAAPIKP